MTSVIEFRKAFQSSGIEFDAQSWTQSELKSMYADTYSDDQDFENLLDLAKRLGVSDETVILSTYKARDKSIKFSVPRVHLDAEGHLCLFLASDLTFPLEYNSKNKTYNVGDLSFKVSPVKKKETNEIVAINFSATITKSTSGYEEEFILQLGVLTKPTDLVGLVKALQSGSPLPENSLVQIGVGTGSFEKAMKPWMLPKGFYRVMSAQVKSITKKDGTTAVIRDGFVSPVVDGVVDESQIYFVLMSGNPFNETLVNMASKGFPVYFGIDGGYPYDKNVATIGYATRMTEAEGPNRLDTNRWKQLQTVAKRKFTEYRLNNKAFTDAELAARKSLVLGLDLDDEKINQISVVNPADVSLIPF